MTTKDTVVMKARSVGRTEDMRTGYSARKEDLEAMKNQPEPTLTHSDYEDTEDIVYDPTGSSRKFLGNLSNDLSDYGTDRDKAKVARAYNQRMLKAYLKGKTGFHFGFSRDKWGKLTHYPMYVLQSN